MQYMLLCCIDEGAWTGLAAAERDQVMKEYDAFVQGIVKSGHYRAGGRLDGVATSTTLRERNGRLITTDGPFAETKEQLGGYHLIECRDLDEALAIARRIPTLRVGGAIEVRPTLPAFDG
jgi:hypothetical protein